MFLKSSYVKYKKKKFYVKIYINICTNLCEYSF